MKSSNELRAEEIIKILKEILNHKGAILNEKKIKRTD